MMENIQQKQINQTDFSSLPSFKNDIVRIQFGNWKIQKFGEKIKIIKSWRARQIVLNHNQCSSLVKQIEHINFPNLKLLFVSNNFIQSVENFVRILAPSIQFIKIHQNKITSLKTFRKGYFPCLEFFHFYNNFIHSISWISESRFPFVKIFIEMFDFDPVQIYDFRFLAKLCIGEQLKSVGMRSMNRIRIKKAEKTLLRKYQKAKINTCAP